MSKIHAKLNEIQTKLVVPKGQYNKFGKYHYRSSEDILKAVTPHLQETQTTLIINDKIILVGDRYYLEANATLTCCESGENVSAQAMAREDDQQKGMSSSQLSGSTSSYARKYALNALFAIDDTKDSDATNKHGKSNTQEKVDQKIDSDDDNYKIITDRFAACSSIEELDGVKKDIGGLYHAMSANYQKEVQMAYEEKASVLGGKNA